MCLNYSITLCNPGFSAQTKSSRTCVFIHKRAWITYVCKVICVKLQITLHSSLHPFHRHPLAKSVYICQQGGPGAPGLKGDGGDSGPPVRTPSLSTGPSNIHQSQTYERLCYFFSSKGPRGLQGPTGPPGKSGKRVTVVYWIVLLFLRCNDERLPV